MCAWFHEPTNGCVHRSFCSEVDVAAVADRSRMTGRSFSHPAFGADFVALSTLWCLVSLELVVAAKGTAKGSEHVLEAKHSKEALLFSTAWENSEQHLYENVLVNAGDVMEEQCQICRRSGAGGLTRKHDTT